MAFAVYCITCVILLSSPPGYALLLSHPRGMVQWSLDGQLSVELTRSGLRPTYRESQPRAPELRRSSEWFLGMPKSWHEGGLFVCQGLRGIGRECRKDVGGWDTDAGKERA